MKKSVICLLLSSLIGLCSCNSNLTIKCVEYSTSTSFSASYELFSGKKNYTIQVKEGERKEVKVEIKTTEGKLIVEVGRKDEPTNYEGNIDGDMEFVLNLNESGSYYVSLKGEKHKGSYKFSW
ncbi:MAG: hypothetical protein ACI4U5_02690 [Bacilli bacterium]